MWRYTIDGEWKLEWRVDLELLSPNLLEHGAMWYSIASGYEFIYIFGGVSNLDCMFVHYFTYKYFVL